MWALHKKSKTARDKVVEDFPAAIHCGLTRLFVQSPQCAHSAVAEFLTHASAFPRMVLNSRVERATERVIGYGIASLYRADAGISFVSSLLNYHAEDCAVGGLALWLGSSEIAVSLYGKSQTGFRRE
jgi:hypothetical protein